MPFVRDWTPFYDSNEAQLQRDAEQRSQNQRQMLAAIANSGSTLVGAVSEYGRLDLAQKSQALEQQRINNQQDQFQTELAYRKAERDRLWQQDDATRSAAVDLLSRFPGTPPSFNPNQGAYPALGQLAQRVQQPPTGGLVQGSDSQPFPAGGAAPQAQPGAMDYASMGRASAAFLSDRVNHMEQEQSRLMEIHAQAVAQAERDNQTAQLHASPEYAALQQRIVQNQTAIEQTKNQGMASQVAKRLPFFEQNLGMKPEKVQAYLQAMQENPASAIDINHELDALSAYNAAEEVNKLERAQHVESLRALAMDPNLPFTMPDPEMRKRLTIAPALVEAGTIDITRDKNAVWNFVTTGNSKGTPGTSGQGADAFTRRINMGVAGGLFTPERGQELLKADTERRSGVNAIEKNPDAIGKAREDAAAAEASVKSAAKALEIANKRADAKPDDADLKEAARLAQVRYDKALGAEGVAKGAKGKAEAGSRAAPGAPTAPTATAPAARGSKTSDGSKLSPQDAYKQARMKLGPNASPDAVKAEANRIYESQ